MSQRNFSRQNSLRFVHSYKGLVQEKQKEHTVPQHVDQARGKTLPVVTGLVLQRGFIGKGGHGQKRVNSSLDRVAEVVNRVQAPFAR